MAWKRLGDSEPTVKSIADYDTYRPHELDDQALVTEVWHVLDDADIILAHFGDAFDLKKLNARFVFYGLNAPSPYQSIDTKKVASKYFKFDSNSLNNLGAYLNVGKKIENGGFDLWIRCMAGDPEAWTMMKAYNGQDVQLLEQVYYKLRPFMTNHPDLNMTMGKIVDSCPSCQSGNVHKRGFAFTKMGKKQRYQCTDCGSWSVGGWQKRDKDDD